MYKGPWSCFVMRLNFCHLQKPFSRIIAFYLCNVFRDKQPISERAIHREAGAF